ncbi:MAG TPA: class F sortase [Ktedonobacteraceae bacterium]|nr:class F sortase [Ktedonobacteraceae bacterium]
MKIFKRRRLLFVIMLLPFLITASLMTGILLISSWNSPHRSNSSSHTIPTEVATSGTVQPIKKPPLWAKGARLEIPAIALVAPIEDVGIRNDGTMEVPHHNQWEGVGWYKFGTFPGKPGSAVIDGHLDKPGGYPAVFWNLNKLQTGDIIKIVNPGKKTLRFQVRDMQYYQPKEAPLLRIFSDRSGAYLNLITCAGEWIASEHQTALRLVVYTRLMT